MNSNMICHNNSTHWAPICSALALVAADQHAQTLCAQAMHAIEQTSVWIILEAHWTLLYVLSTECLFDGFFFRQNVFSMECPFDNFFDSSYFRRNVFSTFRRASSGVVLVLKRFN
jgi:hypothetical protein